ncbi:hypothetical protein L3Q82_011601 [Scortum barcoo]|uniref:Uncharacterized protein n=1 Tax=Scortum barcoo TaxID=214431 RepID=A0ACB8W5I6_9TELE|nr:hypothetical protein L3Q82_011601 [Scortum barcoo]
MNGLLQRSSEELLMGNEPSTHFPSPAAAPRPPPGPIATDSQPCLPGAASRPHRAADQDQEPGPAQVRAAVTQQGILLGQHDANIRALVEANFFDLQVATRAGVPFEPLEKPRDALAVDGRIIARVTHRTQPLTLVVSGNHSEKIQFLLISAPNTPLILGFPWLATHNPHLDWTEGKLLDWSFRCHETCLRSALSPMQQNQPVLVAVPLHRWMYLASRRSITISKSRLYHLSRPESEAMEKYIKESLVASLIPPSKAPLGAGFFFIYVTLTYHLVRIRRGDEWKTAFNTFYRRFIQNYSQVVTPLTALTSPAHVFQWGPEADRAFSQLKHLFSSAPILTKPDPASPFVVEVEASDVGVGAVLSQRQGPDARRLHPMRLFLPASNPR